MMCIKVLNVSFDSLYVLVLSTNTCCYSKDVKMFTKFFNILKSNKIFIVHF